MHVHFVVPELNINPAVTGVVVDAEVSTGAVTVLFSVFTQVIVCAAALEGRTFTIRSCPSVAEVVVIVIVKVAALSFVTLSSR